ncbi:hypothetical protein DICPUDRAFT_98145 [Dictyostelium purpureum]|uniref:ER membrane protein complex subunit 7 beta-sandwich domain-containing protein n=1 Tax=Dictyostelium purpureum TaxID=5786 RepID=F0ZN27_DICPU|nr:uncharacterized protein DICPUDRAFT_98145 [Dictyostelium purpureum]EGC34640.1 hypothetical protein DICPUDRAFT_98145 [Dictyostelium purpureum]|eukprot:XP_003288821.1 hypothetical protein DICPUDRAFT_98145 [Dictyostelium purpureum]
MFEKKIKGEDENQYTQPIVCNGFIKFNKLLKNHHQLLKSINVIGLSSDGKFHKVLEVSSTGYYSFSIVNKGQYSILLKKPNGWDFNLEVINLDFDLKMCDNYINFELQGFSIEGSIKTIESFRKRTESKEIDIDLSKEKKKYYVMDTYGNLEDHYQEIEDESLEKKSIINNAQHIKLELVQIKECDQNIEGASVKCNEVIQTINSNQYGVFIFKSVLPAHKYIINIKETNWSFQKYSLELNFNDNDKLVLKDYFIANAFDVVGKVMGNKEESLKNVQVNLYSNVLKAMIKGCTPTTSSIIKGYGLVCSTVSDKNGKYVFRNVPIGEGFKIIANYKNNDVKYQVIPEEFDFSVDGNGTIEVDVPFQVKGFAVNGFVFNDIGEPIEDAEIYLNGEKVSESDSNGIYIIDYINEGVFEIEAKKENYIFNKLSNHIVSSNSLTLPNIRALSYEIPISIDIKRSASEIVYQDIECIVYEKKKDKKQLDNEERNLIMTHLKKQTKNTDKTITDSILNQFEIPDYKIIKFFNFYTNGYYTFKTDKSTEYLVKIKDEHIPTINLINRDIKFKVEHKPTEIVFSQLLASIRGTIRTITYPFYPPVPSDLMVELLFIEDGQEGNGIFTTTYVEGDIIHFEYNFLLPNKTYMLKVCYDNWSWEKNEVLVHVSKEENSVEFVQSGFKLFIEAPSSSINKKLSDISISHRFQGEYENIQLNEGINEIQIVKPGIHEFIVKSCFNFENEEFYFDTDSLNIENRISLKIKKYILEGSVDFTQLFEKYPKLKSNITSIKIHVFSHKTGYEQVKIDEIDASLESFKRYHYSFLASENDDTIQITPVISINNYEYKDRVLFYPISRFIKVSAVHTCQPIILPFVAMLGKFLNGRVLSGEKGVEIEAKPVDLYREYPVMDKKELIKSLLFNLKTYTDNNGHYKIGPMYTDLKYSITAKKEGRIFVTGFSDSNSFDFSSTQLYTIIVNVKENGTNIPFENAFVSLSPKDERSNGVFLHSDQANKYVLKSNQSGVAVFNNILPNEYILRCHIIDHKLKPQNHTLQLQSYPNEIKEKNELVKTLDFFATLSTFKIYGKVSSVNSLPFSNIMVLLFKVGRDENKLLPIGKTYTDSNGNYIFSRVVSDRVYQVSLSSIDLEDTYYEYHSTPIKRLIRIENNSTYNNDFILISKQHKNSQHKLQSTDEFELSGNIIVINNQGNSIISQHDKDFNDYILNSISIIPNNIKANVYYGGILIKSLDINTFNTFITILKKPKNFKESFTVKIESLSDSIFSSFFSKNYKEIKEIQLSNECIQQSYCHVQFELNYKPKLFYIPSSIHNSKPSLSLSTTLMVIILLTIFIVFTYNKKPKRNSNRNNNGKNNSNNDNYNNCNNNDKVTSTITKINKKIK